jgi:hypothetical protein
LFLLRREKHRHHVLLIGIRHSALYFLKVRIVEVGPERYTAMEELLSRGASVDIRVGG